MACQIKLADYITTDINPDFNSTERYEVLKPNMLKTSEYTKDINGHWYVRYENDATLNLLSEQQQKFLKRSIFRPKALVYYEKEIVHLLVSLETRIL
jgi:hypothetical protein